MADETRGASKEAIQHHYDVGNDFYRLWLDDTMTYSGALWGDVSTLEHAQLNKLDFHIEQARAAGAARVLDVGCGWGSLLERLGNVHAVTHPVGLTLSREQADWIRAKDIPGEVRLESWSEHEPAEPYDAIISIGSMEHFAGANVPVAEKIENYRRFFARCHRWLKPGGRLSVQAIAYGNLLRSDFQGSFVAEDIFPESDFVRLPELAEASEFLFEILQLRNDPEDYLRTCEQWRAKFAKNRSEIEAVAGKATSDLWARYLEACVRGWQLHATHLLRITFQRVDHPRVPPDAEA